MLKTTRHILKADEVTFEKPLQLGLDPAAQPPGGQSSGSPTRNSASGDADAPCDQAGPSVRIAENRSEYAVIEITCACGKTTYVRCDYAASAPPVPVPGV